MRKQLLIATTFLSVTFAFGQNVGIGIATPNASAKLDVTSTNSGVLIPRLALTAANVAAPVTSPATSLLVYNTATASTGANAVTPGYYYWNGAKWVRMIGDGEAWKTNGNLGTNATSNFLGTTDNVALRIRTNNTERFEFSTDGRLRSFSNGSAGLPTYSWTGDTDMGVYRIGTNTLGFSTSGLERMRIAANGNVGINAIPNANNNILTLDQTTATGTSIYGYTSVNSSWVNIEGNSAGTTQGVGVRGLGYTGVEGNTTNTSGGWAGYFDWDTYVDWMFYTGATMVSDRRMKEDIRPVNNGIGIINSLNPVIYNKKRGHYSLNRTANGVAPELPKTMIPEYGFIAQEIKEVLPELVKEKRMIVDGEEMDVMGVNYEMLIPILTKAIQEQQTEINLLKARLEKLESQEEK